MYAPWRKDVLRHTAFAQILDGQGQIVFRGPRCDLYLGLSYISCIIK
jgi:hypothetical protein